MFERLQENIRMNGCRNVTAFNEAVQGRSGDIDLFVDRKSAFSTTSPEVDSRLSGAQPTKVPVRAIASALELAGPSVALLKMDCEGAEFPGQSVDAIPRRLRELGFDVRMTTPLTACRRPRTAPLA